MYKQSPSRNHRSKGIKVKHVLQICVLLAVCFWLIYQVKHSHGKRKEFDRKDEKVVEKVQTDDKIRILGRKDLPRSTEIATDVDEHQEDEEEKEVEEEESNHEEDEPEREDSIIQDREDEDVGRGGGDDEIDEDETDKTETESKTENKTEKTEAELEPEEEQVDEEKEREENEEASEEDHTENEENEDDRKEGDIEGDVASNDQDRDGGSTNTHEAREEQYKADDASSEVTHDTQTFPETGNVTTQHTNEVWGKVNSGHENETKTSDKDEAAVQPNEDEVNGNATSSNVTVSEPMKFEINSTKSEDSSGLLLSNGTQTSDANLPQNATEKGTTGDKESILLANVSEHINKSELALDDKNQSQADNVNTNAGEFLISSNTTSASSHNNNGTNTISVAGENSGNGLDESSNYRSSDEGVNTIQHDPIDVSDTTLTMQEEKESRMDLDTLPEIRNEIQNTDDTMAE